MTREEIMKIARQAGAERSCINDEVWMLAMAETSFEKFAALVAEADREDAERYRWLKDNNASFSWNPSKYNEKTISGFAAFGTGYCDFEFEDAIDKARGEK